MCGIAGFVGERGALGSDAEPVVRRMADLLTHRGPDERGTWIGDGAGMACRRLAIVDVEHGSQPIRDPASGAVIVFNGEIYEHEALRRELSSGGYRFRTRSDTEVLLAGYLAWGEEVFERVDGMLACAIYRPDRRELILARDRFGKKPLFHCMHRGVFHFASEMKSLLALPGFERRLDDAASEHFLLFEHVFDPMTPFVGVHALPPAHVLRVRDGEALGPRRYWSVPTGAHGGAARSFGDAAEELSGLLADAVARRTTGDVAVGALLSGGIDSSLVCAALAGLGGPPLDAFSITFGDPALDESAHQDAVAQHLGIGLHRFELAQNEAAVMQSYPEAQWFGEYADPSFEQDILFRHLTALAADRGYKVLLGGEGADELFRGYRHHRLHPHLMRYLESWDFEQVPASLGFEDDDDFADLAEGEQNTLAALGVHGSLLADFPWSQLVEAAAFETLAREVFVRPPAKPETSLPPLPDVPPDVRSSDRLQSLELHTRLPAYILRTLDRYSMASSVEVRCPFLDHRLLEWFMGLPTELRERAPGGKPFLAELATTRLPASIAARPKQGFRAPRLLTEMLRSPDGHDHLRALLSREAVAALSVVRPELVEKHLELYWAAHLEDPQRRALSSILERVLALRMLQSVFVDDFELYERAHLARHGLLD